MAGKGLLFDDGSTLELNAPSKPAALAIAERQGHNMTPLPISLHHHDMGICVRSLSALLIHTHRAHMYQHT